MHFTSRAAGAETSGQSWLQTRMVVLVAENPAPLTVSSAPPAKLTVDGEIEPADSAVPWIVGRFGLPWAEPSGPMIVMTCDPESGGALLHVISVADDAPVGTQAIRPIFIVLSDAGCANRSPLILTVHEVVLVEIMVAADTAGVLDVAYVYWQAPGTQAASTPRTLITIAAALSWMIEGAAPVRHSTWETLAERMRQ